MKEAYEFRSSKEVYEDSTDEQKHLLSDLIKKFPKGKKSFEVLNDGKSVQIMFLDSKNRFKYMELWKYINGEPTKIEGDI